MLASRSYRCAATAAWRSDRRKQTDVGAAYRAKKQAGDRRHGAWWRHRWARQWRRRARAYAWRLRRKAAARLSPSNLHRWHSRQAGSIGIVGINGVVDAIMRARAARNASSFHADSASPRASARRAAAALGKQYLRRAAQKKTSSSVWRKPAS